MKSHSVKPFAGEVKWWAPNQNSTFVIVQDDEIDLFEAAILSATRGVRLMSWGLTYPLPWPRLDMSAVEAAIRHVLAQLPPRPRESKLEVRGPDVANWFVAVYPDEERLWTLDTQAAVERRFALYEVENLDPLWVDIVFSYDSGDPTLGIEPRTTFSVRRQPFLRFSDN